MQEPFDIEAHVARWLANDLQDHEKKQFQQWMNEHPDSIAELHKLKSIWEMSSNLIAPEGESVDRRWEKLLARTTSRIKPRLFYRIAASLALIAMVTALWIYSGELSIKTVNAQIKEIVLPDGSLVTLNAGTVIYYNPRSWFFLRKVTLEGEAFFNVKKNNGSFIVHTSVVDVKVLGTTFNVKVRNKLASVSCISGSVAVTSSDKPDSQRIVLTKGMSGKTGNGKLEISNFDIHDITTVAWMDGKLYFKGTPLREVFDEIERFYAINIVYRDRGQQSYTFSGTFENSKPAEVLNVVCLSAGLKYKEEKPSVFVVKE